MPPSIYGAFASNFSLERFKEKFIGKQRPPRLPPAPFFLADFFFYFSSFRHTWEGSPILSNWCGRSRILKISFATGLIKELIRPGLPRTVATSHAGLLSTRHALVWAEMCWKHKIPSECQTLRMNEAWTTFSSFYLCYVLRWGYFGYIGLNK